MRAAVEVMQSCAQQMWDGLDPPHSAPDLTQASVAVAELIEAVGDTDGRIMQDERGQELVCIDPAKWQRITVAYVVAQGGVA